MKTPSDFTPTNDGTFVAKCFKCGEGFDIIDVLAWHYNLSIGKELFSRVATDFNLHLGYTSNDTAQAKDQQQNQQQERKDYAQKLTDANRNLYNFVQDNGGKYRGLPFDLLNKFNCGYAPQHLEYDSATKKYFKVPRFTIPTSNFHYLGRLLCSAEELEKRGAPANTPEKKHWGTKEIFNFDALASANADDIFFCVEGEFDAMSIIYAGFNAIALSGSEICNTKDKPVNQQKQLQSVEIKPRIMVLFDNDATGKQKAAKVVKQFRKLGYFTAAAFLPTTAKSVDLLRPRIMSVGLLMPSSSSKFLNWWAKNAILPSFKILPSAG